MPYWIGLVGSWCVGFLVAGLLFRRHILHQKKALRSIMYQTHHQGINPVCKRIRGITTLGLFLTTNRDMDHESWHEIREYFIMIEKEALELETTTLKKVKEFEHLQ
jgi:hypothetical protein